MLLLLLLVADICADDLLVQSDSADTGASRPVMSPGKMPLAPSKLPMHPDRRLAFEPSSGVSHPVCGRNTETQMPMIGHGVALDEFDALLLAQLPDDSPNAAAKLPRVNTASLLWDNNKVIHAVSANVRWALPVSHENPLPCERGSGLKGGSLLHSWARRNGRAPASLTA